MLVLALQPEGQRLRAAAGPGPDLQELDDYTRWLPRRVPAVPAATLAVADRYARALTGGRWRSAHLLIARRDSGSRPMALNNQAGDQIELILDDYIAEGPPEVAAAAWHMRPVIAHAHPRRREPEQPALPARSRHRGSLGAALARHFHAGRRGAGNRGDSRAPRGGDAHLLGSRGVLRPGGRCRSGAAAMNAVFDTIAAQDARPGVPSFARRAIARLLNWGAPPPYPPTWLCRAVVRLRYRDR